MILTLMLLASCAVSRQSERYCYHNVLVVDDGAGGSAFYPHVVVRSYDKGDSLTTVSFVDMYNHLFIICGKEILVETIVSNRYDVYGYDYYRPANRYYVVSRRPRYHHNYRPSPNPHPRYIPNRPHNRPPQHSGHRNGGNPPHRGGNSSHTSRNHR